MKLDDVNPVLLSCQPAADGAATLVHEGAAIAAGELIVELDQHTSTQIVIADFEHEGQRCRANAFTIAADGALSPWTRVDNTVVSPPLAADDDGTTLRAVIVPVAYEPAQVVPAAVLQEYEPDSWHTMINVDVGKKGSKPTP